MADQKREVTLIELFVAHPVAWTDEGKLMLNVIRAGGWSEYQRQVAINYKRQMDLHDAEVARHNEAAMLAWINSVTVDNNTEKIPGVGVETIKLIGLNQRYQSARDVAKCWDKPGKIYRTICQHFGVKW
jgi:hypothetical protein